VKQLTGIVQLIDSLEAGGAERMAVNIANALALRGLPSSLMLTRKEGMLKAQLHPQVKYVFLNKKYTLDLAAVCKARKFIVTNNIAILHAHTTSWFFAVLLKITKPSLKLIWHDHYGKSEQLSNRPLIGLKWAALFFDSCIAVNGALKEWIQYKLKHPKVFIINNFSLNNASEIKQTILKGKNEKRILCLANLRPQKDHLNLLKSFKIINEIYDDWTLHIVGLDFKDHYSQELKKHIKKNRIDNHVFFYGSCPDTEYILSQASIGVLSSDSEGLPLALIEYGLANLGVVVTDVGDCCELIENGTNGFLVQPKNAAVLAEKLIALIENKEMRLEMGKELHNNVMELYSKEKAINQLISLYRSLD